MQTNGTNNMGLNHHFQPEHTVPSVTKTNFSSFSLWFEGPATTSTPHMVPHLWLTRKYPPWLVRIIIIIIFLKNHTHTHNKGQSGSLAEQKGQQANQQVTYRDPGATQGARPLSLGTCYVCDPASVELHLFHQPRVQSKTWWRQELFSNFVAILMSYNWTQAVAVHK